MSDWGPATFGDPCRACGFAWTVTQEEAIATVTTTPSVLAAEVTRAHGSETLPDLEWPVIGYVCHVSDNLRIWAERLAGLAMGDARPVARFDQDLLAQARQYDGVSLVGALWMLGRSVEDWRASVRMADGAGIVLIHPERGEQTLLDVVRSNAHDAHHHCWDVHRILAGGTAAP